jgi:hypothetical protein
MLDQLAQHHQPPLVAERLQQLGNIAGIRLERRQIHRCLGHRLASLV